MLYADYDFYTNVYMGREIKDADFMRLLRRASGYLEYYTQGRVKECPCMDSVKMACCALIEQYQLIEDAQTLANRGFSTALESSAGEIQSETVGSHSVTRRSGGDTATSALAYVQQADAMLANATKRYLAHTGLLYRGRRRCTHRTL